MLPYVTLLMLLAEPQGALSHKAPVQAKANRPLEVDGSYAGPAFKELVLLYRGPGQDYHETTMANQYGDLFRGTIPAEHLQPPGVEYYVEGRRGSGERVAIYMSARKPARVLVLAPDTAPAPASAGRAGVDGGR